MVFLEGGENKQPWNPTQNTTSSCSFIGVAEVSRAVSAAALKFTAAECVWMLHWLCRKGAITSVLWWHGWWPGCPHPGMHTLLMTVLPKQQPRFFPSFSSCSLCTNLNSKEIRGWERVEKKGEEQKPPKSPLLMKKLWYKASRLYHNFGDLLWFLLRNNSYLTEELVEIKHYQMQMQSVTLATRKWITVSRKGIHEKFKRNWKFKSIFFFCLLLMTSN